jgi:hypothetical protein
MLVEYILSSIKDFDRSVKVAHDDDINGCIDIIDGMLDNDKILEFLRMEFQYRVKKDKIIRDLYARRKILTDELYIRNRD